MPARIPIVAANWKMHKTLAETEAFLDRFLGDIEQLEEVELFVCPPFPSLAAAAERCRRSRVMVAAQNMHAEPQGAFTGEVSAPMLTELGVEGVILGHSERRAMFAETDEALASKVPAALGAGLTPILCVGETEAQRDGDQTESVLARQLQADLAGVDDDRAGGRRDCVRAGLGDRYGSQRDSRPGRRGDCLHKVRGRRAERARGRRGSHSLRRFGEARERRGPARPGDH